MGRIPKVNVHCHFLHFNHLPDEYTRYMIKKASTFSVSESWIEEKLSKLVKNRTGAFANSLKDDSIWGRMGVVDNYIKKGEYLIEKDLEKEKIPDDNDDRYDIITPLMMDMINATNLMEAGRKISEEEGEKKVMPHHRLYNKDGVIPYTMQVLEYSYFASKYPYQILPFVNFNPLRYKCLDLCKDAVVNYGFVGVKLYPCLGFYPFKHSKNDKISEELESLFKFKIDINKEIENFYLWANELELPVTIHAQYNSMQNISISDYRAGRFNEVLIEDKYWPSVLETYKKVRINFAHMGGIEFSYDEPLMPEDEMKEILRNPAKNKKKINVAKCTYSKINQRNIIKLIEKYDNVYADVAAMCPLKKNKIQDKFFKGINDALSIKTNDQFKLNTRIMFGTDTPASIINNYDYEMIEQYKKNIKDEPGWHKNFFSNNALDFIFGEKREYPDNYIKFLKKTFERGWIHQDPVALPNEMPERIKLRE